MDKKTKIREIFSNFDCEDFFTFRKLPKDSFHCDNASECGINISKEPIWSPAYGDENYNHDTVMFVAEAPSTTGGTGVHLGGMFKDWPSDSGQIIGFRDFFVKELGFMPYFTDLVKCGPANSRDKKTIKKRAEICVELFLLREIQVINPDYIYCIGRTAYEKLKRHEDLVKSNGKPIKLKQLIHYGSQAGLHLKIEDKELIWRWQLGRLAKNRIESIPLSELSYFKRGIE